MEFLVENCSLKLEKTRGDYRLTQNDMCGNTTLVDIPNFFVQEMESIAGKNTGGYGQQRCAGEF